MFKKISVGIASLFCLTLFVSGPSYADDRISFSTRPDEIAIFLNNIAYARDTITLPGNVDVEVVLPNQIYQDTLVLRENAERVTNYRIRQNTNGQLVLAWASEADAAHEVTLEYLLTGVSWQPKYDMWLGEDTDHTVEFAFFAQITNASLEMEDVTTRLVAGRVDTSSVLNDVSTITTNQYIAGYADVQQPASFTGSTTIQHVYTLGKMTTAPGDTLYTRLSENVLAARRLLLWNAQSDTQVSVIYKVRNESELPFAEGIVRTYQNDLFLSSDFIELTPIGSEGSITVGKLQNVRVQRDITQTAISGIFDYDTRNQIQLTLSNFGDAPVVIEVVDSYPSYATNFVYADSQPEQQVGNLLRWQVTIEPGATLTINYEYIS